MNSISNQKKPTMMIIGVDGCTFDILNKYMDRGLLPNFSRLMKEGAYGRLRSTIPPGSPAAWSTFQTGKDPGKHGIFDFFRNVPENYTYTPVNATFLKEETFWKRLSRLGKSVGVVNFLFTYPPSQVNGYVVSGKETPSEQAAYACPETIKEDILKAEPGFEVDPFKRITHSREFLMGVIKKLEVQERVNRHLIKQHPTDLFMSMFAVPDVIQHLFWHHMDETHVLHDPKKAKQYTPLIENIFQTLDGFIGNRLQLLEDDATVVVVSDHGFCNLAKIVQMNKWFQDNGLMFLRKPENSRMSFVVQQLKKADRFLSQFDRFGLRRKLKLRTGEMRRNYAKANLIDWSRTRAYMGRISEGGIFCNLKGREKFGIVSPGKEYEELRDEIIKKLRSLKDPETGQTVFKNVYKREDLYQGVYVKYAPDIILETGDHPYQEGDSLLCPRLFEPLTKGSLSGKHHPDGILMVSGKGVRKNHRLTDIHIRDVAPTVLYMMDEKVPVDMDGSVISELFDPETVNARPVEFDHDIQPVQEASEMIYDADQSEEIEKRLKDLGYL